MTITAIILAAGQGKRMCSSLSKVLHPLAGKPLLEWVLAGLSQLPLRQLIVVCGHQSERLKKAIRTDFPFPLAWVEQVKQLGTGHAVLQALPYLQNADRILIASGDMPLIRPETFARLCRETPEGQLGMITAHVKNPFGCGRIIRNSLGEIQAIMEESEASKSEKAIQEVNSNVFCLNKHQLDRWLPALSKDNGQGEYYLTDIVNQAVMEGTIIHGVMLDNELELRGVNNKVELAALERDLQRAVAEAWMLKGVTILDPSRLDIRGEVVMGVDVTLDVNVILEGRVTLGDGVTVGPNCYLKDVQIEAGVFIAANSVIEGAVIQPGCHIGPFARIRPGTRLEANARVGNFVEIKNSHLGENTKVNHLSYIGDAELGAAVNIGAGTVTCNYDGVRKHKTVIQDNVFVGSGTQLIAPITVGKGALIGAGTTLTRDVPAHQLIHQQLTYRRVSREEE